MKVLVLGDGKLASEIVKQTGWDYISRKKDRININNDEFFYSKILGNYDGMIYWKEYDVVVNCIANTNTYSTDRDSMRDVNFLFPKRLSDFCAQNKIKLVHISTDYVYANSQPFADENSVPSPLPTWYTHYKLLADEYISATNSNYLICRCSFKSNPFEFEKAWVDQIGNFDYVDVITDLIISLIKREAVGIFNVGTELKSIYDLAKKTNPNVVPTTKPMNVPADVTINTDKLNNLLNN